MKEYILPDKISGEEIKEARAKLKMTQREFADLVGVSKPTVERWEASKKDVTGPIAGLLYFFNNGELDALIVPAQELPTRMWYMHQNRKCTLIDVDDSNRTVKIKNYDNRPQFRAFGVNESPSYEDYLEFLESRCFPESRDKMKLILKDLDLPFYDPFLIVSKTKGRMAEDDFWLDVKE